MTVALYSTVLLKDSVIMWHIIADFKTQIETELSLDGVSI